MIMCHRILLSFRFFQPFKNVKTILSSQAIQKQIAGPNHQPGLQTSKIHERSLLVIKQVQT